jgi:hypothetical protein
VTIEVVTDHTGTQVISRCEYDLHLAAPAPVASGDAKDPDRRWLIQVPIQLCAVEGSELAATRHPGELVPPRQFLDTLRSVNDTIWYPQAQVAFSTAREDLIPVIADPSPPIGGPANGQLGDVRFGFGSDEARDMGKLCGQAWQATLPGRPGIPVVNARQFLDSPALGVSPKPDKALQVASPQAGAGLRGDDLCGSPVRLTAADLGTPFVTMVDQNANRSTRVRTMAHELGHTLFLGHGNGLDDNGDGKPAGVPGARRYDEYCDPGWLVQPADTVVAEDIGSPTPCSLMQAAACSQDLRPLQVETARGVALVVPGAVNGAAG